MPSISWGVFVRVIGSILVLAILAGGVAAAVYSLRPTTVEEKTVRVLAAPASGALTGAIADDQFAVKVGNRPLPRDEDLARPEPENGYLVNLSPAIVELDLDVVDPETDRPLAKVYSTYQDAFAAAQSLEEDGKVEVLPSASMVYSMTRQFDQGLIAAAEIALLDGKTDAKVGIIPLFKELLNRLPDTSKVRPYVAALLKLVGVKDIKVFPEEITRMEAALVGFRRRTLQFAPPLDHYAWAEEIRRCYNGSRYLQDAFPSQNFRVATEMGQAFHDHPDLLAQYEVLARAYEILFHERREFLVLDLAKLPRIDDTSLGEFASKHLDYHRRLQILPDSRRREIIHFGDFLPMGFLPDLDLFPELIQRSRIGFVSVVNPGSQQARIEQLQAVTLDMFLSESTKSPEAYKMLLSRAYHERLLGPYFAVHREVKESEVPQLEQPEAWSPGDGDKICPRFRVEPVPAFYLRLARNYPHIASALEQVVGRETFGQMKRLTPEGSYVSEFAPNEILRMARVMYGLYLFTCEDLAVAPTLNPDEQQMDLATCRQEAADWLSHAFDDEAARRDVRFATPVDFRGENRNVVLWSSIGVRLHKMSVRFSPSALPSHKGLEDNAVSLPAEPHEVGVTRYVLPVLELAGLEVVNRFGLDPKDFRQICEDVSAGLESDLPKVKEATATLQSTEELADPQAWPKLQELAELHNHLTIPHDQIDLKPLEEQLRRAKSPADVEAVIHQATQKLSDALAIDLEKVNARDAYVEGIRRTLKAMQPPSGGAPPTSEQVIPAQAEPAPGPTPTLLPGLPDPTTQPINPGGAPGAAPGAGIDGIP